MNINYELYRIFYVVAKNKNITKASEELNISQPAISKQIKNLEEYLGGTLFIRTKKGVTLTQEGNEFYKYIEKAIDNIKSAENKFTDLINLETGELTIGVNTTIAKNFLLDYLKEFHKKYPKIIIQITTGTINDFINKLRNGLIDIAIVTNNDQKYDDITVINCKKEENIFIYNNEYSYLNNQTLSIKDLNNYPLILQMKTSGTRVVLDNYMKENNIELNPTIELASYSLVTELTKIGLGIGYATKNYVKKELDNKELYELKLKEKLPSRTTSILYSNSYIPTSSTKKLIEIITKKEN